jgi:hypothetical protein
VSNHCADQIDWQALDDWVLEADIQNSNEALAFYEATNRQIPQQQK